MQGRFCVSIQTIKWKIIRKMERPAELDRSHNIKEHQWSVRGWLRCGEGIEPSPDLVYHEGILIELRRILIDGVSLEKGRLARMNKWIVERRGV